MKVKEFLEENNIKDVIITIDRTDYSLVHRHECIEYEDYNEDIHGNLTYDGYIGISRYPDNADVMIICVKEKYDS